MLDRRRTVVAAALFVVTAAVNLQVPLYTVYAQAEGKGVASTAQIFVMYVIGLVPTLMFFGGVSQLMGRRPVLLAALGCGMLATYIVDVAPSVSTLYAARILQGVGVGLAMGTTSAYLREIRDAHAQNVRIVAISSSVGFGTGALSTSACIALYPGLPHRSYHGYLLLVASVALAVLAFAPRSSPQDGKILRLPSFPGSTLLPHHSIALAWSVSGLVIGVVPSQMKVHGLENWSGLALFLVNVVGVACQRSVAEIGERRSLLTGYFLIPVGLTILTIGSVFGRIPLILVGSGVAGAACYGFTYSAGLSMTLRDAREDEAGLVSGYMLWAYLGFGGPTVCMGYLAGFFGTEPVLVCFSIAVAVASAMLCAKARGQVSLG